MRWSSLLLTFLALTVAGLCEPDRARLRLGPVHIEKGESLEVLVELPEGVTAGASDFQLLEDGRATVKGADLKRFNDSGWTATVVLAVDTSGSMKKNIETVKAALPDFVNQFKGSLALITFGNEPSVTASFDISRDQIVGRISQLRAVSNETRLYAALDKALILLETRQPQQQRQRIVLVSDGEEESQQDSSYLDGVIDKASRQRVAIDTIWTARAPFSSRDTMVRLSERTGGVHGDAQSADQIRAVLGHVVDRIDGALVVSFNRKVQGEGLTRELGVSLNEAGVEPASMALANPIPQSAPLASAEGTPPPPKPTSWLEILKFIWEVIKDIRSWFPAAATLGSAYAVYTASYVAVRKYRPEDVQRFPFNPIPPIFDDPWVTKKVKEDDEVTDSDGNRKAAGRVTIVDHGTGAKPSVLVLEAVKGPLKGERITVDKDYFSIGADPDNDLPISSDSYLSGRHATVRASEDGWVLRDEGSTNGTFVDGKELTSESVHMLQPGQVIRLGDTEFQVVGEGFARSAPAVSSISGRKLARHDGSRFCVSNQGRKMEVAVASVKGLRDENQDHMSWKQVAWGELFIVADGMGGYNGGAIASKMTVEGLEKHLAEIQEGCFDKALQEAVRRVNEQIYHEAHSGNPETANMGTTVVVALISEGQLQFGHIGDSRAYLFRKGRLKRLTKDHTTLQRMLDAGMITADEARNHPDASVLSRAVGSKPEVEIEIGEPVKLEEGDALLLCSDGLSGFVEDRQIRQTLQRKSDIQHVPDKLVNLALKCGSDDNITLQFARFGRRKFRPPESPITWAVLTSIVVLAGLSSILLATGHWSTIKERIVAPAPTIEFKAGSTTVKPGESVKLEWKAQNADKVHIDPGIGVFQASGSKEVNPTTSVKYTATATGAGGSISKDVSVTVAAKPPTIEEFKADFKPGQTTVKSGEPIKLEWKAQNADKVRIDPGIGDFQASGSKEVNPTTSVKYTATATGAGGSISKDVSVTVAAKPPTIEEFKADFKPGQTTVQPGESIKLVWSTQNADQVHIYPDIGNVKTTGFKVVTPGTASTHWFLDGKTSVIYEMTARGIGGITKKSVKVTLASQ